jgi:hypothetical protein
MQMPMLEIPDAAVNEPRRPAGRSTREIVLLDEGGAQASHRGVASDAGSGNPSADDEDVELLLSQSRQAIGASHQ